MIYRSRTISRGLIVLIVLFIVITLPIYWLKNHREILNLPKFIRITSGELPVHANWDSRVQAYDIKNQSDYYISEALVTFSAYDIYTKLTFKESVKDNNWGRRDRPVINISWQDAVGYIQWVNLITFTNYRLPTESEWEYAARAGSTDRYNWGPTLQRDKANCLDCLSSDSLNNKRKLLASYNGR